MESGPWRSLRHFDSRLQGTDLGELIAVPKANMKESKKGWLAHTPFSTRGPRGEPPQSTISGPCFGDWTGRFSSDCRGAFSVDYSKRQYEETPIG